MVEAVDKQRTSGLLPYGHFGVQLLVLRTPTDEKELQSKPVTREPATEADNEAEEDVSEEMRWVTPAQKCATAGDTTGYDVRSWPRRQVWKTTLFAPGDMDSRQGPRRSIFPDVTQYKVTPS